MSAPATPVWRIVAEREMSTRIRDKAFLGATAFTLVLVVGFFVFAAIMDAGSDEYDVAVASPADRAVAGAAEESLRQLGASDPEITVQVVEDQAAAEELVRDSEVDAALLSGDDGYQLVGDDEVDTRLAAALSSTVARLAVQENAAEQGVDLAALNAGSQVEQRLLAPNAAESDARSGIAFGFAIVFLMTALGFGMTIAASVAQEKESRVVELLAAAVPIRALLWGKILGNTALALGQVVLIVVVGLVGLTVTGRTELLAGVGPAVLWYVAFFVLGFVTLAALWSVAGSLVSRQEDLQASTLPGQLLVFVPYFISVVGSDRVQTVASMFPIASTMVMPGRMAQESVPWWQVGVGIGLTVLAAVVFVRVGSRIYERALLRTGSRISYREAMKLSA